MTSKWSGILCAAAFAGITSAALADDAPSSRIACTGISTAGQLQSIRNKPDDIYCLTRDIDAGAIVNFIPIGTMAKPFTGQLLGGGHTIRNLKINRTAGVAAGLFGVVKNGRIHNVRLVNAKVRLAAANGVVGALAGWVIADAGANVISRVTVAGQVTCVSRDCLAGGIVGYIAVSGTGTATVRQSSSAANVAANGVGGFAGGAIGGIDGNDAATVDRTFATGRVKCATLGCAAGGLMAFIANAQATRSFATGPVSADDLSAAGGLIALADTATVRQSYATGSVKGGVSSSAASLIGEMDTTDVSESFGVGKISGCICGSAAGLIAFQFTPGNVVNSYWDIITTKKAVSDGGTGRTTPQLRAALPTGFDSASWRINKTLSYPFLNDPDMFASTLATLVLSQKVFTFIPIGQNDPSQYWRTPAHADAASLATVYTMMARAVGNTDNVALLQDVKIDKYFWNDATQTATFTGPLSQHAKLGPLRAVTGPLSTTNVIAAMNARHLVILRGSYTKGDGTAGTHYMLATLYTKNNNDSVKTVVANDPFTGAQVEINPFTRKVTTSYPLTNFTVDGYQTVTTLD